MGKKKKEKRTGWVVVLFLALLAGALFIPLTRHWEAIRPLAPDGTPPGAGKSAPTDLSPPAAERRPADASPRSPQAPALKVAILIDDIGHDLRPLRELLRLGIPLNFAVLPYRRHSREAAEMIHDAGQEVLLHLPMEPRGYPGEDPGEGALLVALSDAEIARRVERALDAVPHIRGVNNHMGSAFMAEEGKVSAALAVIGKRNLYFVDSRTTANSRVEALAVLAGVPFAARDIFLDNGRDAGATLETLKQAVRKGPAGGRNVLVMIGHPYPETLAALQEALAFLKAEGTETVHLSSLLLEGDPHRR